MTTQAIDFDFANNRITLTWTSFKEYLDGTLATLKFHYLEYPDKYTVLSERFGTFNYICYLNRDAGTDVTDFDNNFKALAVRSPVPQPVEGDSNVSGTVTVNPGSTFTIAGSSADNSANSSNKLPVIVAKATVANPSWTEGNMVPLSVDNSGALRVGGSFTATNPSVGSTGASVPASATLIGTSDGTNLLGLRGSASAPSGTENGLIVRNIPSGTQSISGTITADAGTGPWPVTDNGGSLTVDTPQLPASLVSGRLDNNIGAWFGSTSPTVGQKTAANSIPVTFASDQSTLNVTVVSASNTTPNLNFGDIALAAVSSNVAIRRTTYTEQSVNFTGSIVSASANDTAAGTGARSVKIYYVNATGTTAGTETVTLNGTTPVNLAVTTKCFIDSMKVVTVGSGGKNAGIITLKTGAAGAGTTVGTIAAGDNQTYWCHHYVLSGKTANISGVFHGNSSTVSGNTSFAVLRAQKLPIAGNPDLQVSDFVAVAGAANPFNRNYISTIQVEGPARVCLYVSCVSSAAITYRGSFDSYE